jgi:hypothetical protein
MMLILKMCSCIVKMIKYETNLFSMIDLCYFDVKQMVDNLAGSICPI